MPRNWLKSTVFTQWGSLWLYLQDPNTKILIVSQNEDIAKRFLHFIKHQAINNTLLRKLYPEMNKLNREFIKDHRWSATAVDFPRPAAFKEATITSIGITGAAQSGHYDLILIDDPVGQKQIDSPVELDRVVRWHDNSNELLINPNWKHPEASMVQIVCTFWGPGDYGTYVLDNCKEYHWRIVPCLKTDVAKDTHNVHWIQDEEVDLGYSNWETAPGGRSTTDYYRNMLADKELQLKFWSQHMNMPDKGTGLNKFDIECLKYYTIEERDGQQWIVCEDDKEEFLLKPVIKHGMIDPGGFAEVKLMKRGSRNAMLIGGQPHNSIKKFVFYLYAGRLKNPSDFLNTLFDAHSDWQPRVWRIETIAAQQYIYKDIVEEKRVRGVALSIDPMPKTSARNEKDDDIQALIHPMYQGQIYLRKDDPYTKELVTEIANYPHSITVDLLDMLGKINKFYWKRRPPNMPLFDAGEADVESYQGRDPVTGY